jgi:hypothetical protein
MSDNIRNDAAQPEWRTLCEAAMMELDSAKLLERISEARSAIVKQIKDAPHPSEEQFAMRNALGLLRTLNEITEREIERNRPSRLTA